MSVNDITKLPEFIFIVIHGMDDDHVGYGENSHNDGDWTETEFNLKGITEDDYNDGLYIKINLSKMINR